MINPLDASRRVRAVLFDVDGTLYRQRPMRAFMAVELMSLAFTRPLHARQTWSALSAYRRTQEALRLEGTGAAGSAHTGKRQFERAAATAGVTVDAAEQIVTEWMFERPLKYLRLCRPPGLLELITFLKARGVELGVLSDYPADGKLRALGLTGYFSIVLCTTDAGIDVLKPNPRGFVTASERWSLDPSEVLVIGDRVEVDAAGAAAAGMPCVIIGRARGPATEGSTFLTLPTFERLRRLLDDR